MNTIYENKYKLGEIVWIMSEDNIPMPVKVCSISLIFVGNNMCKIIYNKLTLICTEFYEDEVIRMIKPVTITATELNKRYKDMGFKEWNGEKL